MELKWKYKYWQNQLEQNMKGFSVDRYPMREENRFSPRHWSFKLLPPVISWQCGALGRAGSAGTLAEQQSLCAPAQRSVAAALTGMWCWALLFPDKHQGVCRAEQEKWHWKWSPRVSARGQLPSRQGRAAAPIQSLEVPEVAPVLALPCQLTAEGLQPICNPVPTFISSRSLKCQIQDYIEDGGVRKSPVTWEKSLCCDSNVCSSGGEHNWPLAPDLKKQMESLSLCVRPSRNRRNVLCRKSLWLQGCLYLMQLMVKGPEEK